MDGISTQVIVAFVFGVIFIIAIMVIAFVLPNPTPFQYQVFRTIISIAVAGIAAMIPGFISVETYKGAYLLITAGGALAVFVIVYKANPAKLIPHPEPTTNVVQQIPHSEPITNVVQQIPPIPEKLPSGEPFPTSKQHAFNEVWVSLISLDDKGQDLWNLVTTKTLKNFAEELNNTKYCVRNHALFFNDNDYTKLNSLLKSADFYLDGKTRLSDLYGFPISRKKPYIENLDKDFQNEILRQIQQNKKWLSRYRNLLSEIRSNLHSQVGN